MEDSEELARYACSSRVLPLMTTRMHARRTARLVQQPMVAAVSDQLFNFASSSQAYLHRFPQLSVSSCLSRLMALVCTEMGAKAVLSGRRQQPTVAAVLRQLSILASSSQAYLHRLTQLSARPP